MKEGKLYQLARLGQSIWLDSISREMLEGGRLKELIAQGVRGLTSNPSIFDKAISQSQDYDKTVRQLCGLGKSTFSVYDDLTVKDIQDAADLFGEIYRESKFLDGYVSLEIDPRLAMDTRETVKEGLRLAQKVDRPNLMLKVPATEAGFPAVTKLLGSGINVNVTLIFSLEQYRQSARAYLEGIKQFAQRGGGGDLSRLNSVASVFVSRIDTRVDKQLEEGGLRPDLRGKAAVANSCLIYRSYREIFSSEEFKALKLKGANPQRALWGSTGTKNPAYSEVKYVEELIGEGTVNTVPENTLAAFLRQGEGEVKESLSGGLFSASQVLSDLKESGILIDKVCEILLAEGLLAFEQSFSSLLRSIEEKARVVC